MNQKIGRWTRFLPKSRIFKSRSDNLFISARQIVDDITAKNFDELDTYIDSFRHYIDEKDIAQWIALLIMQAPRAAHAQAIMDEYPHGYHEREKRLYELIDFNDTLVSSVLLLPENDLATFTNKLKREVDMFCARMYSRTFDNEQFDAIVHGLSREIAVFKAAKNAGLTVVMTSRVADAFGIDMQIADPALGRYINVDCKTSSSFHFRLKNLVRQHRVKPRDVIDAETKGWWEIVNRDHKTDRSTKIILLRVSQDELGIIKDFKFVNEQAIIERLREIIAQRSLNDSGFGERSD